MADKPELDRLVDQLKRTRDELKVQANLAKAELRDEWQDLEKKWSHLRGRLDVIGDATEEVAEEVLDAVKLVGEELKSGYEKIRRLL